MLKATEYEILRNVKASGQIQIPMKRQPIRVATLIDEERFVQDQFLSHLKNVFLEDRMHDWDWRSGQFRYYTRVAEVADVVIVYAMEDVKPTPRFDTKTGLPLAE